MGLNGLIRRGEHSTVHANGNSFLHFIDGGVSITTSWVKATRIQERMKLYLKYRLHSSDFFRLKCARGLAAALLVKAVWKGTIAQVEDRTWRGSRSRVKRKLRFIRGFAVVPDRSVDETQ